MRRLWQIALAALAAMALAGPSGASAAEFTTSEEGQELHATLIENYIVTNTGSSIECETIELIGESENGATLQTHPVYDDCTAAGLEVNANTEGCVLTLKADTEGDEHATVNLSGCTNGGIVTTVDLGFFARCTVKFKNQSIDNAVHYTDTEGRLDIEATANTIHADVVTSDGLCPIQEGTHTNASIIGASNFSIEGGTIGYES